MACQSSRVPSQAGSAQRPCGRAAGGVHRISVAKLELTAEAILPGELGTNGPEAEAQSATAAAADMDYRRVAGTGP